MSQFVLFITLKLKPGTQDKFMPLIQENARSSVNNEPGCSQFDVLLPEDGTPDTVYLYEVYDDADAFAAHQASDHYINFKEQGNDLVDSLEAIRMNG